MKIFLLGGVHDGIATQEVEAARASMRALGGILARTGHGVALCSPYPGSIDHDALEGIAASGLSCEIEMHYPETRKNQTAVKALERGLGVKLREVHHPADPDGGPREQTYSWLLAQLSALDAADLVVAAGGRLSGSASMLLRLAEARRRPVLPLGHLGGAAAQSLDRLRHELDDQLGELRSWLRHPDPIERLEEAIDQMVGGRVRRSGEEPTSFFISYSRHRQAEADLVETLLRRRGRTVFRGDQAFDPSAELHDEIENAIRLSDVFVALWSAEYACSPWCHDEMTLALELLGERRIDVWLLTLDETRIVPGRRAA